MTIYFIRAGRHVKVGYTSGDPVRRLKGLQTGNAKRLRLIATMPGTLEDEARMHELFKEYRLTGEWFSYGSRIRKLVRSLKGWNLDLPAQDELFITELWHCLPDIHRGVDHWAFSCLEIAENARKVARRDDADSPRQSLAQWDETYVIGQFQAFGIKIQPLRFWDAEASFWYPPGTPIVKRYGFIDDDLYEYFRLERKSWIDGSPLSVQELADRRITAQERNHR